MSCVFRLVTHAPKLGRHTPLTHTAANKLTLWPTAVQVWDLRTRKLLRSVPLLDGTSITFSSGGDLGTWGCPHTFVWQVAQVVLQQWRFPNPQWGKLQALVLHWCYTRHSASSHSPKLLALPASDMLLVCGATQVLQLLYLQVERCCVRGCADLLTTPWQHYCSPSGADMHLQLALQFWTHGRTARSPTCRCVAGVRAWATFSAKAKRQSCNVAGVACSTMHQRTSPGLLSGS
jgi:hypothetical protein